MRDEIIAPVLLKFSFVAVLNTPFDFPIFCDFTAVSTSSLSQEIILRLQILGQYLVNQLTMYCASERDWPGLSWR